MVNIDEFLKDSKFNDINKVKSDLINNLVEPKNKNEIDESKQNKILEIGNIKTKNKEGLDVVDKVIQDLKEYTYSLIKEDTALARQIEEYLTRRRNVEQAERDNKEAAMQGLNEVHVSDEDIVNFKKQLERQSTIDVLTTGGQSE